MVTDVWRFYCSTCGEAAIEIEAEAGKGLVWATRQVRDAGWRADPNVGVQCPTCSAPIPNEEDSP